MRWPWQKRPATERRESGGDFADAVVRLLEADAAGMTADATRTAAVEAAAGALSRALAAATVEGPDGMAEAVSPGFLAQVGRDLVRSGDSLHAIRRSAGRLRLIPCASWHWEGNHDPASWTVRATAYGPSTSTTWKLPASSVVFATWGSTPGQPYIGTAPTSWASVTARLGAASERTLADEAGGPLAQVIPLPIFEGKRDDEGDDEDTYAAVRAAIAKARGKAVTVETTADGGDRGKAGAPQRDWQASRLGPAPPAGMVELARDSFLRTLAACGCSPALFDDSDGTAKREALRQWHLGTVQPLARMLSRELSVKLAAPIRLSFDLYNVDLAGRAGSFQKLVAGGMPVTEALAMSGLLAGEDA